MMMLTRKLEKLKAFRKIIEKITNSTFIGHFFLDSVIKMINFDISLNERKLFDHIFTGLFTLDSKKS